ncbi:MAG: hypothetical protein JSS83_04195 [Cyanobacteria bacterium SZAS LIN-3]|nr:hypothetical protein [Cyanobacteria bacterium SZAS LIN-3]
MQTLIELEKAEQESIFLSIFDSISDGVIVCIEGRERLLMNSAAQRIIGLKEINKPMSEWSTVTGCYYEPDGALIPWEDLPLPRALRGESIDDYEILLNNKNLDQPVWVSISGRPLTGGAKGGVIIIRDITAKKKIDQETLRSNLELQQFAYVAAHDLQEPLRTVVSYLDLIEQRCPDQLDDKGTKYLTSAVKGARRMQLLISDLLRYSRVSARKGEMEEVDMERQVRGVMKDFHQLMQDTEATIEFSALPTIKADRSLLTHLFQNLIGNALKYHGPAPLKITISATKEGSGYKFMVADNGIGFEMEYAERIFLMFQRLHGRDEYPGTGIGLALCKRIVDHHNGRIWAVSAPGKGSTFYFTINT